MSIYKTSENDNSKLIKFTRDLEYSRFSKNTNFKKGDIYSFEYLSKYENIQEIILIINNNFKSAIEYIDTIPAEQEPSKIVENEVSLDATIDNIPAESEEIVAEPNKIKVKKTKK